MNFRRFHCVIQNSGNSSLMSLMESGYFLKPFYFSSCAFFGWKIPWLESKHNSFVRFKCLKNRVILYSKLQNEIIRNIPSVRSCPTRFFFKQIFSISIECIYSPQYLRRRKVQQTGRMLTNKENTIDAMSTAKCTVCGMYHFRFPVPKCQCI